ncbi:NAD(P)H-binding protein [bacterium]|nr:NAD(P)H-binding protein [bacterium]
MPEPVLVIGASGTLGREVVRRLDAAGYPTRRATRNPDRDAVAEHRAVRFSWDSPLTFEPAVEGVAQVLLTVRPLDLAAAVVVPEFLEACLSAGVGHVTLVSALGADEQRSGPLGLVEHVLAHSGLGWTILRPNFFMENFSHGWLRPEIQSVGRICLPADSGRTSFVSVDDVAEVAARVLRDPDRRGQAYDLTGDDPMSHTAVAAAITRASGRPVNYHPLTEDEMRARGRRAGLPPGPLEYLLVLYALVREGRAARVSGAVKTLLGRKPRSFDDFAEANADRWRVGSHARG